MARLKRFWRYAYFLWRIGVPVVPAIKAGWMLARIPI